MREFPLKRLRNNLISSLSLQTALEPVGAVIRHEKPNTLRDGKHAKQTIVWNPLWDVAPRGAYYKARRACSLVTDICLNYTEDSKILHELERLSIFIWKLPKRHFDGLLRTIRSKMTSALHRAGLKKNPEALMLSRQLINHPFLTERVHRFTSNRVCRHNAEFAALRLSKNLGNVRLSLGCTKCTVPACAGKWFTPQRT